MDTLIRLASFKTLTISNYTIYPSIWAECGYTFKPPDNVCCIACKHELEFSLRDDQIPSTRLSLQRHCCVLAKLQDIHRTYANGSCNVADQLNHAPCNIEPSTGAAVGGASANDVSAIEPSTGAAVGGASANDVSAIEPERANKRLPVVTRIECMAYEYTRQMTFKNNWIHDIDFPVVIMARGGFFREPNATSTDEVRCNYCQVVFRDLIRGDYPERMHYKYFTSRNTPINRYCILMKENLEVLESEGMYHSLNKLNDMRFIESRRRSFDADKWPSNKRSLIDSLVAAGFYFDCSANRHPDSTTCAYCNGSLYGWSITDNPFEEHAKYYTTCPYMRYKYPDIVQSYIHTIDTPASPTSGGTESETVVPPVVNDVNLHSPSKMMVEIKEHSRLRLLAKGDSDMTKEVNRLLSFTETWIHNRNPIPLSFEKFTTNGLYYTGTGCELQCAFCTYTVNWPDPDTYVPENHKKCRKKNKSKNTPIPDTYDIDGHMTSLLLLERDALEYTCTCVVCMDRKRDTVLLPCGHLLCHVCEKRLRKCPYCNQLIRGTVKVINFAS